VFGLEASLLLAMGMATNAQSDLDQRIDNTSTTGWEPISICTSTRNSRQKKKRLPRWSPGQLKKIGYEVTDHFGKYDSGNAAYGVVAVLHNGQVRLLRAHRTWMRCRLRRIRIAVREQGAGEAANAKWA